LKFLVIFWFARCKIAMSMPVLMRRISEPALKIQILFLTDLFAVFYLTHVIDLVKFLVLFKGNLYAFIGFSSDLDATVCTNVANFDIITIFQVNF
jgi:hypothetical protein